MDTPAYNVLVVYLVMVNVITFVLFCDDKSRARGGRWRIPERVLLGACAVGGALGGLVGMRVAHHKTRKPRFAWRVPALLALQVMFLAWMALQ